MNGSILALLIAGLFCFGAGAYLAATDNHTTGIVLMSMGLIFQVLTLRQIKQLKKEERDAR